MAIPLDLSPSLWLKADGLSAGALATWPDSSGNGNDATQATEANRPTVVPGVLNGLSVVRATRTGAKSITSPLDLSDVSWTAFVVGRRTGGSYRVLTCAAINWLLGWWNDYVDVCYYDALGKLSPTPDSSDWKLYAGAGDADLGIGYFWSNGNPIALDGYGHRGPNRIGINSTVGEESDCDVAEILVFPTALSDTDREAVEAYLHAKWFEFTTSTRRNLLGLLGVST